jgi:hypothetical protein
MPQEVEVSATPTVAWSLACATLCSAIVAYGVFGFKDGSGGLAYQIGASIPSSAMLAGLLHFAFRRRVATPIGWLGFALVFASLVTASMVAYQREQAGMRKVSADAVSMLTKLKKAIASGETLAPLPVASNTEGDAGKMTAILGTMINRALALRRDYEAELARAGWTTVLDGKRLIKDKSMSQTHAVLLDAAKIMDKYETKNGEMSVQIRADIENSAVALPTKQSMLRGFDKSIVQGKVKAAKLWALEREALAVIANIVKLLDASRGAWHLEHEQFAFERQPDLDQFNALLAQLQAIGKKQEQMQSNALQKAQDQFETIGR